MSNPSMATEPHLASLRSRLLRFPERRAAADRVGKLKLQLRSAMELRDDSANVRRQCKHVAEVFEHADMSTSELQLQNVQVKANALLRTIETGTASPDLDVQQGIIELKRAVQRASSTVEREWSQQVEAVVSKYERLSQALQRAGVRGSDDLLAAVARLRAMPKPPRSHGDAHRASKDIKSVGPTLVALGLHGGLGDKVGGFLIAVAEGRGSADALLEADVRAFLDTHDLWSVLTVSFR